MHVRQSVIVSPSPLDRAALAPLAEIGPQLVVLFGSIDYLAQEGLNALLEESFPGSRRIGCSTAGEITGDGAMSGSCVVTAVRFEHDVNLRSAHAEVGAMGDSSAAGATLGAQLADPALRAVLLFGKGLEINGSALIEGLVSRVGDQIPVTGGLAGDDGAFRSTLTLSDAGVTGDGVAAIGLYGDDLLVGHGSYGGWSSFGPTRKVTRCEGNILHELDGEPALNVYKRYLGDYADGLPASGLLFPFEMLREDHSAAGLIRTILGVDEEHGSLILAGDIDPNGYLRLMHATTDALAEGAEEAARRTRSHLPEGTEEGLALLVSCVGRKLVMGDQVDDEVEAVAEVLGERTTLAGFYSYGEISPFSTTTECKLHNQTMTVTFIGER